MIKSVITDQISMDLEEALKKAKYLSYNAVEIHSLWGKTIEELTNEEVGRAKELLDKYNMNLSCLSTTLFFICPLYETYSIENFNPKFLVSTGDYKSHLEKLKRSAEISKALNASCIRIFPFRAPNDKSLIGNTEDIENITLKLNKAVEIAKNHDVILVLENCPHSYLPKGIMTKKVFDNINSPNLKLLWDPGNSFRAPINIIPQEHKNISLIDELRIIYHNIEHIHLKDYLKISKDKHQTTLSKNLREFEHTVFGQGSINFELLLDELKKLRYSKYLSLEPEVSKEDTINSMKFLTKMLNKKFN
ncbi:sugar phosphate isomerase/epimerase family protein [Maledivibacter halophilus]|uniref:Sugar phosphate isomerase/epimerase n=1 Tax=Maledivibacter halophilus TaxID=36842 RepID=A0A1T5IDR7_9FIRM|nr:sugar phosphate isomerase/epimerase [Maledivibacter halophilus]SKC37235.1 Sugar phosphate isomerase/epimerase [Maledivibacter halophilus]